jgi:hypothetical protein
VRFTNPTSAVGLKLLTLWLLKVMLGSVNVGVTTIKLGTLDNQICARDMVRRVVPRDDPYMKKSLRLKNTQGSLQSRMPGSNSETRGRLCYDLGSNIMVQYSVGSITTFMAELREGNTWTGWVIRCIPLSRRYFRTTIKFLKTTVPTFKQQELFSHGLNSIFNIFNGQHNHHIRTSLSHSGQFWRLEWGTDSRLQHLWSNLKVFFKKNVMKFN